MAESVPLNPPGARPRPSPVAGLRAVDRLTVGYVVVVALLLCAHLADWRHAQPSRWETAWLVGWHLIALTFALRAPAVRSRAGREDTFLADWYPVLLMLGLYASVGLLNAGGGGGGETFDPVVQRWELAVFGRQIAYDWIRAWSSPLFSGAVHLCYLSYYALVLAAPAVLWRLGERAAARQAIFGISLTFFVCYVVYLLFPVAGPLHVWPLPENAATRVWPARAVHALLARGDAWGSAFPSSHVAASLVATAFAGRARRSLGLVLALPTVGIALAVVYGQIHYGVDALAGIVVAAAVIVATPHLCRATALRAPRTSPALRTHPVR